MKSVERPWEVEKFKLDRKIFSSWKIKRKFCAGFERMGSLTIASNHIHQPNGACKKIYTEYLFYNIRKLKFSAQRSRKTRDFEKNGIRKIAIIA